MPSGTDTNIQPHLFGDVATSLYLTNTQQVEEALRWQKNFRASGNKLRVGEVLIKMNVLTTDQVKKVLSEQRKRRTSDASKALPTEFFGQYKLLEKLGEGGMGEVFKAKEVLAERIVALKVLRASLANNRSFVERFDRERKLAENLKHPNIVACYTTGMNRGVPFMAMEFVNGEPLNVRLKHEGGKLPEKEVLRIVRELALGLAHAHGADIIHRDVKPDNIFITKQGTVKLGDFGTAKSLVDEESVTATGLVVGTPHYISPEQVRNKGIDHRADLYSVGATMYQMLTGRLPFNASSPIAVMKAHLDDELESPLDIVPELSVNTVQIVMKLMAKSKERRYQSGEELAADCELVMSGKPARHAALDLNESSIRVPQKLNKHGNAKRTGCFGVILICATLILIAASQLSVQA